MSAPAEAGEARRLRRELNVWEAIGISVALMAPSMAANINPQGTAQTVGRAVPLAFALATVGVLLVAYTFVRLCQRYNHAGSVYAFVGATLGPHAGVVAGWALMGTYIFYGVVTSMAAGIFGTAFLDAVGIWNHPPTWAPFLIAALALVAVFLLAAARIQGGTRLLLAVEGTTVLLILIVSVIVLAKLLGGTAPGGHKFTASVFTVPHGTPVTALFLGVVFGFLSFAGFEASATLGEEARRPRRDIPRAILGTAIFGGLYFVFVTAVEVMGFGADDKGVKAFSGSQSLLGDLATNYIAGWVGDLITLGTAVSAFGCALASTVAAARLMFALARDGVLPGEAARVSPGRRTPVVATLVVVVAMYVIIAVSAGIFGATPFKVFVWSGVIGTLILLVAYAMATIGMVRLVFFSGRSTVPMWQIVVPILALVLLGYTLYRNVIPYPTGAAAWFPVVCIVWLVVAIVLVFARPQVTRRAGERLTREEGLGQQVPEASAAERSV